MEALKTKEIQPTLRGIFNIAIKAPDIDAELAFLSAFNPDSISKVQFGPNELNAVEMGGVRFFLFEKLKYEDDLEAAHPGGVAHLSFMVDDLNSLIDHLAEHGITPFRGPYEGQLGDLGKRMVAMFRSPNGTLLAAIPSK